MNRSQDPEVVIVDYYSEEVGYEETGMVENNRWDFGFGKSIC